MVVSKQFSMRVKNYRTWTDRIVNKIIFPYLTNKIIFDFMLANDNLMLFQTAHFILNGSHLFRLHTLI